MEHLHRKNAVSGYRSELGLVLSDSSTTVQTSLENIPREGLSIPVHGLCVVDNTYCIGERVQVKGEKLVSATITGIFRDGTVALRVKDYFSYVGKSMSGKMVRKLNVPYSIRAHITDVKR
jgi:hypothetical protein